MLKRILGIILRDLGAKILDPMAKIQGQMYFIVNASLSFLSVRRSNFKLYRCTGHYNVEDTDQYFL